MLWSLGNEEWAVEGNEKGARITSTLQRYAQRLDPTRRTTVALSGGWGKGISTVLDVMGYNYISHGSTDEQHAQFPQQPGVGTEETTTQCTRGIYFDDRARGHAAPIENGNSGGNAEIGWRHYAERPYLAGLFYWTGFDYRGEPNPFGFPAISSQFGILDTCGFPKDGFYYLKAWWTDQPVLHVFPHWTWPGREGQKIDVRVHSNADEVELLLNGESLGKKPVVKNDHLAWQVTYKAGTLEARAYRAGKLSATERVETCSAPTALRLEADGKAAWNRAGDVVVFNVSAQDAQGRAVPTADAEVTFTLKGPGKIIGVGNGDPSSHEADTYFSAPQVTALGPFRERVASAPVLDDQGKPLSGLTLPELAANFDDSGWHGSNDAKVQRVFRLKFAAPALPPGATARLLLRRFGAAQAVYLNGKLQSTFTSQDAALPELPLSAASLHARDNVLVVLATPYKDDLERERAHNGAAALVRFDVPAAAWKRKLFSGLAQVLVQTTEANGTLSLSANSGSLKAATLDVTGPASVR
ncbi:MAG: DUF4982 domain-containing protein [Polyangiaceae bacterium]